MATQFTRSTKAYYFAAFLLGALLALLLQGPVRAADPFRLDRVAIVQFSARGTDKLLRQNGVLDLQGRIQWRGSSEIERPAALRTEVLDRPLLGTHALAAYLALGTGALQGFFLQEGGVTVFVGDEGFKFVGPNPDPFINNGRLINLSTRAVLAAPGDEIIAGFVVEERPRAVLVRVVGPGLAKFGVGNALANPFLSVKQNGATLLSNDDWSSQPDAALVAAVTARVGAFPLDADSRDAARIVVLAPGAYTLHAATADAGVAGGSLLIEIYGLPDDANYEISGS